SYIVGGEHFAFKNQNLTIASVWMAQGTQCCTAGLKSMQYYAEKDLALGQFLVDNCFNPNLKCQNVNCKRSARDHMLSFVHNDGRVNITVGWLRFDLSTAALASAVAEDSSGGSSGGASDEDTSSWSDVNVDLMTSDGEEETETGSDYREGGNSSRGSYRGRRGVGGYLASLTGGWPSPKESPPRRSSTDSGGG
ncbi:unnamed protein product, partial [Laminaria digitata]